jgi:hypothetical protein
MRRIGIILLALCAVLGVGSAAGGLVRAASRSVAGQFEPLPQAETMTPSYWVYMPLVVRNSGVGIWSTVVEEGFETDPGSLWTFEDFDAEEHGIYYWARRTCRLQNDSDPNNRYSAWAVGGGEDGALLDCGSDYPNNVDSLMSYGPFSLKDATAATLSFKLWLNVGDELGSDNLCVYTRFAEADPWDGLCLTYQPSGWAPLTLRLDDDLLGFNLLGHETVWIALDFVSNDAITYPEGAYVDDFAIRKCVGGPCQSAAGAGAQLSATQMRKVQRVKIGEERRLQTERLLLR